MEKKETLDLKVSKNANLKIRGFAIAFIVAAALALWLVYHSVARWQLLLEGPPHFIVCFGLLVPLLILATLFFLAHIWSLANVDVLYRKVRADREALKLAETDEEIRDAQRRLGNRPCEYCGADRAPLVCSECGSIQWSDISRAHLGQGDDPQPLPTRFMGFFHRYGLAIFLCHYRFKIIAALISIAAVAMNAAPVIDYFQRTRCKPRYGDVVETTLESINSGRLHSVRLLDLGCKVASIADPVHYLDDAYRSYALQVRRHTEDSPEADIVRRQDEGALLWRSGLQFGCLVFSLAHGRGETSYPEESLHAFNSCIEPLYSLGAQLELEMLRDRSIEPEKVFACPDVREERLQIDNWHTEALRRVAQRDQEKGAENQVLACCGNYLLPVSRSAEPAAEDAKRVVSAPRPRSSSDRTQGSSPPGTSRLEPTR